MTAVAFDTLKLARKLEAAGFPAKQAADTSAAFAEVLTQELATKADITLLRADIESEIAGLRAEIAGLRADIEKLEMRITIKLGGMMVVAIGVVAALVKLL